MAIDECVLLVSERKVERRKVLLSGRRRVRTEVSGNTSGAHKKCRRACRCDEHLLQRDREPGHTTSAGSTPAITSR